MPENPIPQIPKFQKVHIVSIVILIKKISEHSLLDQDYGYLRWNCKKTQKLKISVSERKKNNVCIHHYTATAW